MSFAAPVLPVLDDTPLRPLRPEPPPLEPPPEVAPEVAPPALATLEETVEATVSVEAVVAPIPLPPSGRQIMEDLAAQRREELRRVLGEDVRERNRAVDIMASMRDGVIVDLRIQRHRFGLKNEAEDIGISESIAESVFRSLGSRSVIPQDLLGPMASCDSAIRRDLRERAIKTPWGFFLPTTLWGEFKERFIELRGRYYDHLAEIFAAIDNGTVETWVRTEYEKLARELWPKRAPAWVSPGRPRGSYTAADPPPADFISSIVEGAIASIPTKIEIREKCAFAYDLSFIHAPDMVAAAGVASSNADLNRELVSSINEQRQRLIGDFLLSARRALLENFSETVDVVTERLSKGRVTKRVTNTILTAIGRLNTLNVLNDGVFASQMRELQAFVESAALSSAPLDADLLLNRVTQTAAAINASMREGTNDFGTID